MPGIPIIIDTDTAQDDCVTILLGLLDPADLRAITMVAGNVGLRPAGRQRSTSPWGTSPAGSAVCRYTSAARASDGCGSGPLGPKEVHGDWFGVGLSMDLTRTRNDPEHAVERAGWRLTRGGTRGS